MDRTKSKYLAWLRRHPCANCGRPGPSEAAHGPVAGMGKKGDDMDAIPLCAVCHRTGRFSMHALGSWDAFAAEWDLDLGLIREGLRERYDASRN